MYATKEYNDKSNAGNEQSYDLNGNMIKDLDWDTSFFRICLSFKEKMGLLVAEICNPSLLYYKDLQSDKYKY
ncbi:MAG: hypothetical protein Q8904_15965 [Bacteroidota bacterium]|nr:hypothetical protein [Bacteroidota bacterium]